MLLVCRTFSFAARNLYENTKWFYFSYDKPKNVFGEEGHHFSQQCKKLFEASDENDMTNFVMVRFIT